MNHKRLIIIGFGSWGIRIFKMLHKNNINIDTIFTQNVSDVKKFVHEFYNEESSNNNLEVLSTNSLEKYNFNENTIVFLLTGPPFHHKIIKILEPSNAKIRVFIEKPYLTSKEINNTFKSNLKPFVDYQYLVDISKTNHSLQSNSSALIDLNLQINIFSKNFKNRKFSILNDFIPHFACSYISLLKIKSNEAIKFLDLIQVNSIFWIDDYIWIADIETPFFKSMIWRGGFSNDMTSNIIFDNESRSLNIEDVFGKNLVENNFKLFIDNSKDSLYFNLKRDFNFHLSIAKLIKKLENKCNSNIITKE